MVALSMLTTISHSKLLSSSIFPKIRFSKRRIGFFLEKNVFSQNLITIPDYFARNRNHFIMPYILFCLITIFTIINTLAATLKVEDWWTEAPGNYFTFKEDGTLHISGNSNGKELFYIIKDEDKGKNLMQNGSGLSINIQLNTETFLNDEETSLYISFHNDNADISREEYYKRITIANMGNSLNIYDKNTKMDLYHSVDLNNEIITLLINFMVKDDMLYCNYTIDGQTSNDFIIKEAPTQLNWKPSFGIS